MLDVLPFAALLDLAGRARIHTFDTLLALRQRDINAVRAAVPHPFPKLRKLYAFLRSLGAMHSLIAMLTAAAAAAAAASRPKKRAVVVGVEESEGEAAEAVTSSSSTLTTLQLKLVRRSNARPFVHMLTPLGSSLRELWLVMLHAPRTTPVFAAADVRALGRLVHLRYLLINATNCSDAEWRAASELDPQPATDEAGANHDLDADADTSAHVDDSLAPPTDADLLALMSQLPHLTVADLTFTGAFSARVCAAVGARCRRLARLHVRTALDIDALERQGPPQFPALTDLCVRDSAADDLEVFG
jgi:hypothetical protein